MTNRAAGRRAFTLATLASALAAPFVATKAAEAATKFYKLGHVYDIQLAATKQANKRKLNQAASHLEKRVKKYFGPLSPPVRIKRSRTQRKLYWDVNTIANHAEDICDKLNDAKVTNGAFPKIERFYFNHGKTQGRYANIICEESLAKTVLKYTTAYDNRELKATVKSIMRSVRKHGSRRAPRNGEIFPIPLWFLKAPYRVGHEEGVDFKSITIPEGKSLQYIATNFMEGDADRNVSMLLKYNQIKKSQIRSIKAGAAVCIPSKHYIDPRGAVELDEDDRVLPTAHKTSKRTTAEKQSIDEIAKKEFGKLNGQERVRKQGLGVLRNTKMPGILVESFNLQSKKQRHFYNQEKNIRQLGYEIAHSALDYAAERGISLTHVIVDNGHGVQDKGATYPPNSRNPKAWEGQYTIKLQKYIAEYVRKHSPRTKVKTLNYSGNGKARSRVRHYTTQANKFAKGHYSTSLYISTHVDSLKDNKPRSPLILVPKGKNPKSNQFASHAANRSYNFYEKHFS